MILRIHTHDNEPILQGKYRDNQDIEVRTFQEVGAVIAEIFAADHDVKLHHVRHPSLADYSLQVGGQGTP